MELHSNRPTDHPSRRIDLARLSRQVMERAVEGMDLAQEARASEVRAVIERIDRARAGHEAQIEHLTDARRAHEERIADSLEVSQTARLFVEGAAEEPDRAAVIESLRAAYQSGSLNSRERIENAAEKLLGGE